MNTTIKVAYHLISIRGKLYDILIMILGAGNVMIVEYEIYEANNSILFVLSMIG